VSVGPFLTSQRQRIIAAAASHSVPAIIWCASSQSQAA
jgi:hypothetical protein